MNNLVGENRKQKTNIRGSKRLDYIKPNNPNPYILIGDIKQAEDMAGSLSMISNKKKFLHDLKRLLMAWRNFFASAKAKLIQSPLF
jgi:hypothetical protein